MKTINTLLNKDVTVYYPLRNGAGKYETIPYSLIGSIGSYSNPEDLVEFIKGCFLKEIDCDAYCNKMNKKNIELYEVTFAGKEYYYREIFHKGANDYIKVAQKSLQDEFEKRGWDDLSIKCDEAFYCYVDDELIENMSHPELEEYCNDWID